MHVWTKRIAPDEEALWETRMEMEAEGRYAIAQVVGQRSLKLQVYAEEVALAETLHKRYGGAIEELAKESWIAQGSPGPILVKIRDEIIVTSHREPADRAALQEEYPGRCILSIPPELAFGTGEHETTSTCLRFLVDVARERQGTPWEMLDLGTGTGVLAIAAKHLGAQRVLGWENDPLAVPVAERNVRENGWSASDVQIANQDVLTWDPEGPSWDVITANMFSEILIACFPKIRRALHPEGTLLISGILAEQAEETLAAAATAGFTMATVKQVGKWVTARTV